ncbi:uncharacterized protein LOC116352482 [Contarinia nasturtii]|uniref:uncharacterized protein LOC116352482 n=1 Tax=Contarinia nasturtii TaxID=265458 RepID=UPI0012D4A80D|nr:uncharacterized protein LOC116352482 [Contarinia nasturtii]
MDQKQNADQSGPSGKRMKMNDEENNPVERAVVAVNEVQPRAEIFKLNIDCFEEVFDYLSLSDLTAMGQTCKRMERIAGHCFQLSYKAKPANFFNRNSFYLPMGSEVKVDCFKNLLQKIYYHRPSTTFTIGPRNVSHNEMMQLETQLTHSTSIKEIEITRFRLTMDRINQLKVVLSKIERVIIKSCRFNEIELDAFIAACSKVKYLSIGRETQHKCQWMRRIYPTLEHIEFKRFAAKDVPALITFLELNTTIKQFSVDMELLLSKQNLFKNSSIKLGTLAIDCDAEYKDECDLYCQLLNELYDSGFYKKLHLTFNGFRIRQKVVDKLASVKGLVKLRVEQHENRINFGALSNLEELYINSIFYIGDHVNQDFLPKLKRIVSEVFSDDILPFICHSRNLNKIKVKIFQNGTYFDLNRKIVDLFALNKEREKLAGAHKIAIYVEDEVYLATKWAMKQTDFSLIQMKRDTSYDWIF